MESNRACVIDGCDRKLLARGWCSTHYARWKKHGDPLRTDVPGSPVQRFSANYLVNPETGCWEWQGYLRPAPWRYGTLMVDGKCVRAHRFAYETFVGPIPDGLVVDHLCRNPPCVNPAHLEAVTTRVNTIERGMGGRAVTYREGRCCRGHALTEDNIYSPPRNPSVRQCLKCRRLRSRMRRVGTKPVPPWPRPTGAAA